MARYRDAGAANPSSENPSPHCRAEAGPSLAYASPATRAPMRRGGISGHCARPGRRAAAGTGPANCQMRRSLIGAWQVPPPCPPPACCRSCTTVRSSGWRLLSRARHPCLPEQWRQQLRGACGAHTTYCETLNGSDCPHSQSSRTSSVLQNVLHTGSHRENIEIGMGAAILPQRPASGSGPQTATTSSSPCSTSGYRVRCPGRNTCHTEHIGGILDSVEVWSG
mmetsp:Transcript_81061/g.229554  ORF Transcript_81061/g.229554 Transcript_81061/m.229554 type:complete len:223 (-) Transcript_81061:159-827(-)